MNLFFSLFFVFFGGPRTEDSINEPAGQMTIFYRGKISVYDDMPDDKVMTHSFFYEYYTNKLHDPLPFVLIVCSISRHEQ